MDRAGRTQAVPEAVARATYGVWVHNGHDLFGALAHVSRHHLNPAVAALAGEAHDMALRVRWLYEVYDTEMRRWEAAEQAAS